MTPKQCVDVTTGNMQGWYNSDLLRGEVSVLIHVGKGIDKISWTLPKPLLTYHSPFFASALGGSFQESVSNTVELLNDDAPTFEVFIRWLYHGSDGFKGVLGYSGQDYIKAWVLGDKIACPAFTKLMMSLVIRYYSDEWLKISDVQYVYNNSPAGSKLRSWALMQLWWDATLDGSPNVLSDLDVIMMETEDLACDLAKAVVRQGKPTRPSEEDELYQEVPT